MKRVSSKKVGTALKVRAKIDSTRPAFIRSEHTRFPRLGKKWRSSKGIRSKMRLKKRSRAPIVEVGYRGPAIARGLHQDGRTEVLVFRAEDLEGVNKETQVVRISGTVGGRKRKEILEKAKALELAVLNKRVSEKKAEAPPTEEVEEEEVKEEAEEEAEEEEKGEMDEEEAEEEAEEEEEPKPEPKPKKEKAKKKVKEPEPPAEESPEEEDDEE